MAYQILYLVCHIPYAIWCQRINCPAFFLVYLWYREPGGLICTTQTGSAAPAAATGSETTSSSSWSSSTHFQFSRLSVLNLISCWRLWILLRENHIILVSHGYWWLARILHIWRLEFYSFSGFSDTGIGQQMTFFEVFLQFSLHEKMQLMYFDMLKSMCRIRDLCEYPLKITLAKLHFQMCSPDPCISSFLKIINLPQKSDVLKARNQKSIIAAFLCVCVMQTHTQYQSS